jgi:hypothetical protein
MKTSYAYSRRLWVVAAVASLSVAAGIGFCRIEPSGRAAGLIQFDVISELNMDHGHTNTVVFTRYWVSRDYYALSVLWSEPHGDGMANLRGLRVLSDEKTFQMDDELFPKWAPLNTTYPKPLGPRGPFRHGAGTYEGAEMRFAESEAAARRVYVSDLGRLKQPNRSPTEIVDVNASESAGEVQRRLTRLKVQSRGDRIESLELLDGQKQLLGHVRYEYEGRTEASSLVKLVAELPVRPEKLATDANLTTHSRRGPKTFHVNDVDYVYHKGGRTCTVAYRDVTVGREPLRLPVQVEVRRAADNRLLRSARLVNFQGVDLDKAGVWEAAKAFSRSSPEDGAARRLGNRNTDPNAKPRPLPIDPNDAAAVRRLIAKYPVPETPPPPQLPVYKHMKERGMPVLGPDGRALPGQTPLAERSQQLAQREKEMAEWRRQVAQMPKPRRMEIEPNDARTIRQLIAYYSKEAIRNLEEEARKQKKAQVGYVLSGSEEEHARLQHGLQEILRYHRVPPPREKKPAELSAADRELIRQLQGHCEKLAAQEDRGLGGQLQAMDTLFLLDRILKDFDAFEAHTARYLQMVQDAGLAGAYMAGGHGNLETLVVSGRYDKANKLLRQWADRSATQNSPDAVFRFAGWDWDGNKRDPWASVQLLDRFVARPGLSAIERYEGLALRAIALDRLDKLLSSPETEDSRLRKVQAQWVLSTTRKADVAKRIEPALREALTAWQALGESRLTEAKPYSTDGVSTFGMNYMDLPESTALQETSALLDQIVRQRMGQRSAPPSTTRRPENAGPKR